MGSLFDLAAELSQYDEASAPALAGAVAPRVHAPSWKPQHSRQGDEHHHVHISNQDGDSALSLLNETLLTIYATRQPQQPTQLPPTQAPVALVSQRSAPQLLASRSIAIEERSRFQPPTSPAAASTPLQSVFAQSLVLPSVAGARTIPPPPTVPPPASLYMSGSTGALKAPTPLVEDPDVTARKTLREIQEEIEQLPHDATASPRRLNRLQRSLADEYLHERLNKLPPTPFVQLARKKTQQKIDKLNEKTPQVAMRSPPPSPIPTTTTPMPSPCIFPPDQHEMLVKLATIPESHIAKLSSTQQQTVKFAKRYDKILRLSNDELRKLPVSQAQLLQQLQQQMKR